MLLGNQKDYLKPELLYKAFTKRFRYEIGIQFSNTSLFLEENNFSDKTVNAYIVYDLDYCQRNLLNGFVIKNCLLSVTKIVRNSDKSKYVHSGFGIAFD